MLGGVSAGLEPFLDGDSLDRSGDFNGDAANTRTNQMPTAKETNSPTVRQCVCSSQSRSNGVSPHSSEPLPILHWCRRGLFFVATPIVILVEDFQKKLFGGDGASA